MSGILLSLVESLTFWKNLPMSVSLPPSVGATVKIGIMRKFVNIWNICIMKENYDGIFYHCFSLAFRLVPSGFCSCYGWAVCGVSPDRWQAFFPLMVSLHAVLIVQPWAMPRAFSIAIYRACVGFSCPALCTYTLKVKRPLCGLLGVFIAV